VRKKSKAIRYVGLPKLYLETADCRLFVHPYGPQYDEAVGRIYQLAWVSGPDLSETKVAYVKSIVSNIFDKVSEIGELVPIKVFYQRKYQDKLILLARVEYDRYEAVPDLKNRGGNWLVLELYFVSASRIVLD